MDRRHFIRLVGGGAIVSAAVSGCAPRANARAAWDHPGAGETDPRKRALAWAILAPNPHNMQPWMADLRVADEIVLYVDPTRLLPVTDPFNRQIVVGCGGFLELLRMAAAAEGISAEITPFPDGEPQPVLDARPVARVRFSQGGATPDPLFSQALNRRTARVPFTQLIPPQAAAARIAAAADQTGVTSSFTLEPTRVAALRRIAKEGARIEAHTPDAQKESADRTFFGAREVAAHRYGISLEGPAIEAAHAVGLLTQTALAEPGSWAFKQSEAFLDPLADTAQGFVWLTTGANSRAEQIEAGRAYVRANLAAAAEGVAMHPWSQALQEYPTMRALYDDIHRALAPSGGRVQMFVRIGYAKTPVPPAPRRGLTQNLKA
jgi:hypothetical protein